jgi:hypothetical protein
MRLADFAYDNISIKKAHDLRSRDIYLAVRFIRRCRKAVVGSVS